MTTAFRRPAKGQAIPWFKTQSLSGPADYSIDAAGGRPVLMLFFGSAGQPLAADALAKVLASRPIFDDLQASFYGITIDPGDVTAGRIAMQLPGIRYFLDYDRAVSQMFAADDGAGRYMPCWLLLDPMLRVVEEFAITDGDQALAALKALIGKPLTPDWAPIAMVPHVIEPSLCRSLIELYEAGGGEQSGVMRDVGGKTQHVLDAAFKVRRDHIIHQGPLAEQLIARLHLRLMPMVKRSFQYEATRVERLLIGCYDQADGGHFRAHRDDTARGTAHRRFAVTINLNADEYEGGDLVFPEFGRRSYRAPTGGAIVFSCSLLHQVLPVTRGRRFALLPFLYDEAAEQIRAANLHLVEADPVSASQLQRAATA